MPDEKYTALSASAALLIAEGELTYPEIAKKLDIQRNTLIAWRKKPEFRKLVDEHLADLLAEAKSVGIAKVQIRVQHLQRRHDGLMAIIKARSESPLMASAPGGSTGLLARDLKEVAGNEVEVFKLDAELLRELRDIEKQIAQEVGEWTERLETRDVSDPPDIARQFEEAMKVRSLVDEFRKRQSPDATPPV